MLRQVAEFRRNRGTVWGPVSDTGSWLAEPWPDPYGQRLANLVRSPLQLDVFTLVPHAFAWLTEQRPVASVLGTELDLRLFSYRDTTPLRAGQVDDEPYGGGAGMVLRVDVVAAALDAVYEGMPDHRVVALTPQGRQLTQDVVEELAGENTLTLLSARFEGFDERVVQHLASDAISIGPYVLSNGDLPAMLLVDAIARRLPGAIREESGAVESFSAELEGGLEYPHYTRPADFRGWPVPEVLLSGDHGKIEEWRREQSRQRSIR
jgi:tRNA (guanine37-N1)-methyltransferase